MWKRRKTRLWSNLIYLAFFLNHLRSTATGGSSPLYRPDENILLACGSTGNLSGIDDRFWIGDVNSSFFRPEQSKNQESGPAFTGSVNPTAGKAPYKSARISLSEFTYTFPLSAGAKFIRLYFFSTGYPGYSRSNAVLSVKAGPFILLRNFRLADFNPENIIFREYCVSLKENQTLNITFTPSAYNSYAFINGIEILSMPPYLYYTSPDDEGVSFTGQLNPYRLEGETALEMVYRVNVGGTSVSPREDTGMFRRWSMDDDYLAYSEQVIEVGNSAAELKFTKVPAYTAPGEVYWTARTMGTNKTVNKSYNLTWNFPVESGFIYLVRLHFCEFQPQIDDIYERVFLIFIADQIVEEAADVIRWSGGNSVPVYRDYAVSMFNKEDEKKMNLYVALRGSPHDWETLYTDGILNGIEIFKASGFEGNLAVPSHYPPPTKQKHNRTTIVVAVGGGIFGFVVLLVLWFLKFRRGKSAKESGSPITSTKTRRSSPPSDLCYHFSLAKIKAATKDFDQALIIGVGGFGNVYKGYIEGGADPVAIKRLMPGSQQGAHEFETEIEMLSQLRHRHLVSLIGYCDDDNEMILIYDYMARGTLRDYLCNTNHPPLPWKQRLKICIGAARGLNYLHAGVKHMIIHRDVKTTNILLDEKWVAKVSDFGLSKVGPSGTVNAHVSTFVKGTFGYLDPEYFQLQQLTQKSDVYSFGVVLCEVICAKPPIFHTEEMQVVGLANWVPECYHNGTLDQIVDPLLSGEIASECLAKLAEIAVNCLHNSRTKRPSMNDVVRDLELALQLQESVDQDLRLDDEAVLTTSIFDGSNGICSSSCGQDFSEIMYPKGR